MTKPQHVNDLNPSQFIKASDLRGEPRTLTISAIDVEELTGSDGTTKKKGIISFEKTEKQWVLNVTNTKLCAAMFGTAVQEWIGHQVTLYPTKFNGDDCIRVYGSPELGAEVKTVFVELPKRKPIKHELRAPSAA